MILASNLRAAFRSLLRTPVRTFLVLQGIAWGVGIAIFPAAVLEGSRKAALSRAEEVGTGRIALFAEAGARALSLEDLARLRQGLREWQAYDAAPVRVESGVEATGGTAAKAELVGTDDRGLVCRGQRIGRGRNLGARDAAEGAPPVCLLEPAAADSLFPGADPLGKRVKVARPGGADLDLEVVGLVAPRSERALHTDDFGLETGHFLHARVWKMLAAFGVMRPDDGWKRSERCVLVPHRLVPRSDGALDSILVNALPQEAPMLADALRAALSDRGTAAVAYANLVWPVLASDRIEKFMLLKDALVLACLAMGAVVIANVMLLTLLERTGEIAIRRAEGATRGDIAAQFLAEAGVLGVGGAALGVPLGIGLAWVRVQFAPYSLFDFAFPTGTALGASAVGVAAAVLAGVLPARRAALLDPAAALREP